MTNYNLKPANTVAQKQKNKGRALIGVFEWIHFSNRIDELPSRMKDVKISTSRIEKGQQEQGKDIKIIKADVAVVKDATTHTETAIKAPDAKVDATRSQLERKIKQLPQKAD